MKLFKRTMDFGDPIEQAGVLARSGSDSTSGRIRANRLQRLPSFLIIGPPRTGSSWLHQVLNKRALLPSPSKETRFFDTNFERGFEWYANHFHNKSAARCMGEVGPTYFASAEARQRIASYLPAVKVVCVFRNPVERIISLYRLKRAYGMIPWSFEQALAKDPELLESGKYVSNLEAWKKALGEDQVLAVFYEDLRDEPQSFLDTVLDFIEIPRFTLTPTQIRYVHSSESLTHPKDFQRTKSATVMANWLKARRMDSFVSAVKRTPLMKLFLGGGAAFADLPREITDRLYQQFRPDVEALEKVFNRDLSSWKNA
jgi:Sulfotransferase domain